MQNRPLQLSERLRAVASLVRDGARLADVGTDHALLPVYLMQSGRCAFAVASDVHAEPLERARTHIAQYGMQDRIATVLCDGLCGIDSYTPSDIVMAGMGGELICRILEGAPFVRDASLRLILQPMSRAQILRQWLCRNGFCIEEDFLVQDDRLYEILCAHYVGQAEPLTPLQCLIGKYCAARHDALSQAWKAHHLHYLKKCVEGKERGGIPCDCDRELIKKLEELL